MANRALVCALLATGSSSLSGVPDGDDTEALLNVIEGAGALVRASGRSEVVVSPTGLESLPEFVDARLAGTTSRFLTAVASLCPHHVTIDGELPLRQRPMGPLHEALLQLGAGVEPLVQPGRLPVRVGGRTPIGGRLELRGDVSSQFISAIMLIGPMLEEGLSLRLEGEIVSRSYISMTARVMSAFGAVVRVDGSDIVVPPGGYRGRVFMVEPDFSSAAFPICAVLIRGGTVSIPGLGLSMNQGDARILDIARAMGATVGTEGDTVIVARDSQVDPRAIDVDMSDCSDLVPALATVCAVAQGTSRLSGIGFIRGKESDRLGDLAAELSRLGTRVVVEPDGLLIEGSRLVPGVVGTHHDHRLAMAFSVAALASGRVDIENPAVVSKSWPSFYTDMERILGSGRVN